jgi:ABC-type transport system involved in multi-copper enzyme maturation permease subunit
MFKEIMGRMVTAPAAVLAGPVLDKELRVSSRRRRNYVLRFVYLLALILVVSLCWVAMVSPMAYRGSQASGIYAMSRAGKQIVAVIVFFQFVAAQLAAIIMLSTAISDEIYNRTLGVLMTTPITSLQIVMGKLFSKLLQLLGLLAISLPLLAVVRVFGGVQIDYVLWGIGLTVCSVLFVGSLSMFFSIFCRHAYVVIILVLASLGVLYMLAPFVVIMLCHHMPKNIWLSYLTNTNPFVAMSFGTAAMLNPAVSGSVLFFSWLTSCLVMLGGSAVLLTLSTVFVRKAALRQATGDVGNRKAGKAGKNAKPAGQAGEISSSGDGTGAMDDSKPAGRLRRVGRLPLVWKELRTPFFRTRWKRIASVIIIACMLAGTYVLCVAEKAMDDSDTHMAYGIIFVILGTLATAILSATVITSEKEARSWPILLCSPVTGWQIITAKAIGVFKRVLPVWLLLPFHIILFSFFGYIHPVCLIHLAILAGWVTFFLTCSGIYFSSCFKRTTTAVIMNLALAVVIWAVVPVVGAIMCQIFRPDASIDKVLEVLCVSGNPVAQAVAVLYPTCGIYKTQSWSLHEQLYDWPSRHETFVGTTWIMLGWAAVYITAGLFFANAAQRRIRRKIF